MLALHIKHQAQNSIKLLEAQLDLDTQIQQTIKKGNQCINDLISSLRNDPQRLKALFQRLSSQISPRILEMQRSAKLLEETEEELKFKRQQLNKQKSQIMHEKQTLQLSTESVKETIQKIQSSIKLTIEKQKQKRKTIEEQTELSLKEIQHKILIFQKESVLFEKQNLLLRKKKRQIEEKLGRLQTEFTKKALQKDESVRNEKQELMLRLQWLQGEVSEVTELNKEHSGKEKINFDKKLSLYLKAKKFPEYSNSFENSAKTIDQCKEQLFKGIQRMNDASETIARFQIEAKQLCDSFTTEFKRRDEREARIEFLKKEKEFMRDRIISIQNKIKSMKISFEDNP